MIAEFTFSAFLGVGASLGLGYNIPSYQGGVELEYNRDGWQLDAKAIGDLSVKTLWGDVQTGSIACDAYRELPLGVLLGLGVEARRVQFMRYDDSRRDYVQPRFAVGWQNANARCLFRYTAVGSDRWYHTTHCGMELRFTVAGRAFVEWDVGLIRYDWLDRRNTGSTMNLLIGTRLEKKQ